MKKEFSSATVFAGLAAAMTIGLAAPADAATVSLLLESDQDRDAGTEVFVGEFDSRDDLLSADFSSSTFSQLNIGANFSIGGLAFDGQYRLLLESDEDRDGGTEVFLGSFASFDDLLTANFADSSFSQLNIGANFSVGGLAFDGQYQLLLESDEDRDGGTEVFLGSFASFDDLLTANFADSSFSQLNVGANFSVGGLAFDGQYRLLLESDEDRDGGTEVFLGSFASFDDLLTANFADSSFSQLNIGANFSVGGLAYEPMIVTPAPVPLPAGLPLLAGALAMLAYTRRRSAS